MVPPKTFLMPEQYLEIERKADHKSEYFRGAMLAMAGASLTHNRLVARLLRDVGQQLREKTARLFPAT